MSWLSSITGGLGKALSFGGVKASPYRQQQAGAVNGLAGLMGFYQNLQKQGASRVGQYQPQQDQFLQNRLQYLQRPQSDVEYNRQLAGLNSQQSGAFDAARARLAQNLAARGIDGGIAAGAMGNIEAGQARAQGQNAYNLFNQNLARRDQYAQEANALYNQQVGQGYGLQQQGVSGQAGNYAQQNALYGGLANADEQRRAQNQAALMGVLGAAGSAIGTGAAGGAFRGLTGLLGMGRKAPAGVQRWGDPQMALQDGGAGSGYGYGVDDGSGAMVSSPYFGFISPQFGANALAQGNYNDYGDPYRFYAPGTRLR